MENGCLKVEKERRKEWCVRCTWRSDSVKLITGMHHELFIDRGWVGKKKLWGLSVETSIQKLTLTVFGLSMRWWGKDEKEERKNRY